MKKLFILLAVVFFAISCEGPMGPEGPQGPPGLMEQFDFTVLSSDWRIEEIPNSSELYYYRDIIAPEITNYIYEKGAVMVYLVDQPGRQTPLPYVRHYERPNPPYDLFTETFRFNFAPGTIRVFLEVSDFPYFTPRAEDFRVILMW